MVLVRNGDSMQKKNNNNDDDDGDDDNVMDRLEAEPIHAIRASAAPDYIVPLFLLLVLPREFPYHDNGNATRGSKSIVQALQMLLEIVLCY